MRNTNNTYKTQGGDNLVITVKENAPLLEYLINNVSESRSKLKATLQCRGTKCSAFVDGCVQTPPL